MPQYSDTLEQMVGYLVRRKPNLDSTLAEDFLNNRVRTILDRKSFWSGTLKTGKLSVPAVYSTGSVSLTNGSTSVTGSATAWPVSDVVNTTVAAALSVTGATTVTPVSMDGITADTLLYVDSAGTPEIVAVRDVTATTFRAVFSRTHNAGFTLTSSSLSGRQLRISDETPIYTIRAVASTTSITLSEAWAGEAVTNGGYSIVKIYYTLSPDIRDIITLADPDQSIPLAIHVSQETLSRSDAQRASTGSPLGLVDLVPNENGNMQYELYPPQTTAKQLFYVYSHQYPKMTKPYDTLPPFVNPVVVLDGALSDALRTRSEETDPYYDPVTANFYESKFERGVQDLINADEGKALMAYQRQLAQIPFGYAGDWAQSHAVSAYYLDSWT